jgi:hypothetical protein
MGVGWKRVGGRGRDGGGVCDDDEGFVGRIIFKVFGYV